MTGSEDNKPRGEKKVPDTARAASAGFAGGFAAAYLLRELMDEEDIQDVKASAGRKKSVVYRCPKCRSVLRKGRDCAYCGTVIDWAAL